MRYSPEFQFLKDRFKEKQALLEESLSLGGCTSYEEYRYVVGQIRGLKVADAILDDLAQELESKE